jgi:hypothetical protein
MDQTRLRRCAHRTDQPMIRTNTTDAIYHDRRNTVRDRIIHRQRQHRYRVGDPSMVRLSVHTLSLARIPPPTAPLTTTATDSVGCHTRTNFARVGGQRDLVPNKNILHNPAGHTFIYIYENKIHSNNKHSRRRAMSRHIRHTRRS